MFIEKVIAFDQRKMKTILLVYYRILQKMIQTFILTYLAKQKVIDTIVQGPLKAKAKAGNLLENSCLGNRIT